ncbi:hypothetical protein [Mycolicibacterium sp. 120270]|uniref:DUF7159 family protein n=1 Tax=Mycolicibacterium sp. 120270 TaxID=3090600 RepID=UPI00299EDDA3|nr:hypothetical protein [Mycolicibacterium sp. 120270]MDX1883582.1 hypothetical protein [Mycolicibacterium sp. 120270]
MGLSKTSTSIGWVLVDGQDAAAEPLDYDAFDITDVSTAAPAATARRVRDIATASGYTVDSIHVTSSANVSSLRDALTECGFDDVVSVPLTEAIRSWGRDTGYANAFERTAICVLGRDSAALSMIDTRSGAIQSATTTITADLATFISWLNFALGADDPSPEMLYLIGSRPRLDEVAEVLDRALIVPVVASHDAQIALARGAASSTGKPPLLCAQRSGLAVPTRALAVMGAAAVISVFTLSAAGSPIPLVESKVQQAAVPPASAPEIDQEPAIDVPVAPMVFPPPPLALHSLPEEPPAPVASAPEYVEPEVYSAAVPEPPAAPPVEHLPDPLPVEHLPATPIAPGPVAPESPPANPWFGALP